MTLEALPMLLGKTIVNLFLLAPELLSLRPQRSKYRDKRERCK